MITSIDQISRPAVPLVLITDDNSQARLLLRRIFERENFAVQEASYGLQAIEFAKDLHPDLILMDIQMPDMDGFQVVETLRNDPRTNTIPIIVVTAAARDSVDIARGLGLGADDYMVKPFNANELLARVRSKIKARQLEDALKRRNDELERLVQIGSDLNRVLDLGELAMNLLSTLTAHFAVFSAVLCLIDEHGVPNSYWSLGLAPSDEQTLSPQSLMNTVYCTGEAALIDDLSSREASSAGITHIFQPGDGCRCGVGVPLLHQSQVMGVLILGSDQPTAFTLDDVRVLESVASQAALAIRNAQLYTALQNYAHNLEAMVEARTEALQKAQLQLARADKLAAIGTLAAGIAHEINNPLQPLMTNLEMALEDLDANRPIDRELLEFAKNDVQRIKRIVTRILDFARPAQIEPAIIHLDDIVREVLTLAGKQLEHNAIRVSMDLGARATIRGSADQLKQVILNLVVNAMEAMPDGGNLYIQTADRGESVELRVVDNGVGIALDRITQIFDPFFTTKATGTGLGLAVSHSIVEGHGGQIYVESVPNQETTFVVTLPAVTEA